MFNVHLSEAKKRVFEFDRQDLNTFEFVLRSKNDVQVCSMFNKMVFELTNNNWILFFFITESIFQLKFSFRGLFCESDSTFSFIRSSPNKNCPFYDSLERSNFSKKPNLLKNSFSFLKASKLTNLKKMWKSKFLSKSSIKIKHYDKRQKFCHLVFMDCIQL